MNDSSPAAIEAMLATMCAHQEAKVLSLARRLKAGLTPEDIRNPHDHRALDDADFQYEDGLLAGLQSALTAVRALRSAERTAPQEAP